MQIAEDATSLSLVDASSTTAPYVALSYVWGNRTAPWKTTTTNLRNRAQGFSSQCLPRSLLDAVWTTHSLGYHLLWIDCLCIVQDDVDEWGREAANMASTYQNAVATIVADSSDDSARNFLNSQSISILEAGRWAHMVVTNTIPDGNSSTLYVGYPEPFFYPTEFNNSYPATRGWCCQERAASLRTLHFCANQLFWECMHCLRAEDNFPRRYARHGIADIVFHDGTTEMNRERWLNAWFLDFVQSDYSPRKLTYPHDKLNAIAGIAALFHKSRPGRFYAGHWEDGFVESLCWRKCHSRDGQPKQGEREDVAYQAPTWSWASQDFAVEWLERFDGKFEATAEVLSVWTDAEALNPFGEVKGGSLRLRAPTRRGHIVPTNHGSFATETGIAEYTVIDLNGRIDGEVIACLLGLRYLGDSGAYRGYALLLQQVGSTYRRLGMLATPSDKPRALEELKFKPNAPEEFTII